MQKRVMLSAAVAALLAATSAQAQPAARAGEAPSSLALPIGYVDDLAGDAGSLGAGSSDGAVASFRDGDGTMFRSIRYRPRARRRYDTWASPYRSNAYAQLHGGFFDPNGDASNGSVFGFRFGTSLEDRAQLGVGLDWSHRADRSTAVVGTAPLPGGGTIERRRDLASMSSDLLPVQAFVQVSPMGLSQAGPYFGVSGGYEALFVSATDFATGSDYNATFDGWGWQAWGGFAFPLAERTRLTAEVFTNGGQLDREVDDPVSGLTYREIVNVDGAGLRFGLSWAF